MAGCGETSRYKVLTFFFTGVPPPGQEAAKSPSHDVVQLAEVSAATGATHRRRRAVVPVPPYFVHGPFAAGQCGMCHSTTASQAFRSTAGASESALPIDVGPRLAYPIEELCLTCHAEKGPTAGQSTQKWFHGPVASGMCVFCHSPHKSARRYMLDKEPLCTGCHAEKSPEAAKRANLWIHGPVASGQCTLCHDPHAADRRAMLTADSTVALCSGCHALSDIRRNPVHDLDPVPECTVCHNAHLGDSSLLLKSVRGEW